MQNNYLKNDALFVTLVFDWQSTTSTQWDQWVGSVVGWNISTSGLVPWSQGSQSLCPRSPLVLAVFYPWFGDKKAIATPGQSVAETAETENSGNPWKIADFGSRGFGEGVTFIVDIIERMASELRKIILLHFGLVICDVIIGEA